MKAICPNKCSSGQFITVAAVMEDWVVDSSGQWIDTLGCSEILHRPNPDNCWYCRECKTQAVVVSNEI